MRPFTRASRLLAYETEEVGERAEAGQHEREVEPPVVAQRIGGVVRVVVLLQLDLQPAALREIARRHRLADERAAAGIQVEGVRPAHPVLLEADAAAPLQRARGLAGPARASAEVGDAGAARAERGR